jgi:hypothetical protein
MANLFELRKERSVLINKAETLVATAERESRSMTSSENAEFDSLMTAASRLNPQIETIEKANTIRSMNLIPSNGNGSRVSKPQPKTLSHDYVNDLFVAIKSGGRLIGLAQSEGTDALGG